MMSSLSSNGWQHLPEVPFEDIMMMVGLESLENLCRCKKVCRSWRAMIVMRYFELTKTKNVYLQLNMTKHQLNCLKRNFARRLRVRWTDEKYFPSFKEISKARRYGKYIEISFILFI